MLKTIAYQYFIYVVGVVVMVSLLLGIGITMKSNFTSVFGWQWKKLMPRLKILSEQLNEPDLWDDPSRAGKISREHGSIMGKIKEVNALEQELFEHIEMIKLAREENDAELQSVQPKIPLCCALIPSFLSSFPWVLLPYHMSFLYSFPICFDRIYILRVLGKD